MTQDIVLTEVWKSCAIGPSATVRIVTGKLVANMPTNVAQRTHRG